MRDRLVMEDCSDNDYFPKYYVSQPPHRENLSPVYYKVISPDGPVFYRTEGDESGKETSFYDFTMECKNGFGINQLNKDYTPWAEE